MCAPQLFANIDKNLPGAAGELPPVNLAFIKVKSSDTAGANAAAAGDAPAAGEGIFREPSPDELLTADAETASTNPFMASGAADGNAPLDGKASFGSQASSRSASRGGAPKAKKMLSSSPRSAKGSGNSF